MASSASVAACGFAVVETCDVLAAKKNTLAVQIGQKETNMSSTCPVKCRRMRTLAEDAADEFGFGERGHSSLPLLPRLKPSKKEKMKRKLPDLGAEGG